MSDASTPVVVLPGIWGLVPLAGALLVAVFAIIQSRRRGVHASTYVYAVLFAAALLFLAAWCALGLCETEKPLVVCAYTAVLAACGMVVFARERLLDAAADGRADRSTAPARMRNAVLLLFASVLSYAALEFSTNPGFLQVPAPSIAISACSILLVMLFLYFLGQRRGGLAAAIPVALTIAGLAGYFVGRFKATAFMPGDLFAAGTAFAVSGHYTFYMTAYPIAAIALCALAVCALAFVVPPEAPLLGRRQADGGAAAGGLFADAAQPGRGRHARASGPSDPAALLQEAGHGVGQGVSSWRRQKTSRARVAANLALAVVCAAGAGVLLGHPEYKQASGVKLDYFRPVDSYRAYGFLPTFVYAAHDLAIPKPEGYSQERAQAFEDELSSLYDAGQGADAANVQAAAQFDAVKPNVVAIMNESYSDMSIFNGLGLGYDGPPWLKGNPPDALLRGSLTVSVLSGGTCNTEFEFLTGAALGFIGAAKYPYQQYDMSHVPSMAHALADLGYGTHAIHPAPGNNWSRDRVYEQLGFQNLHFVEEFEGAPMYNGWVDDGPTYDLALDIIEKSDEPQFIFDVTVQNHASYAQGLIDQADMPGYQVEGLDAQTTAELNGYLACIAKSDEYLARFVEQLMQLDEPVVLVFFGDHQPGLAPAVNDCIFTGEEQLQHDVRLYQTPYIIWANYDVEGRAQDGTQHMDTSASSLGAVFMQQVGGPLTGYQKAQLQLLGSIPLLSAYMYQAPDGAWYFLEGDSPSSAELGQLAFMQYRYVQ